MEPEPTGKTNPRIEEIRRWAALLGSALFVLALDQLSKAWVTAHLVPGQDITPVPALAEFLSITRSSNRGAAFSFLPQAGDLFLIIALVMIAGIILFYRRMVEAHWIERIALGILLGGVTGNALDRIRLGSVVDFVHLQLRPWISNVSNFADHAIVLGIGILFVVQWWAGRRKAPADQPANQPDDPPTGDGSS